MEYIGKNLKNSDCAIVGIYNALLWMGKKIKYEKIEDIARNYFDYQPENGFKIVLLQDFITFWEIPSNSREGVPIFDTEKEILNGKGALAIFKRKGETTSHMIFLKANENRGIDILNSNIDWMDIVSDFLKKEVTVVIWTIDNTNEATRKSA